MGEVEAGARDGKLNIIRCALTGAGVLGVLYALCWLGAALNVPRGPHMFLAIFSPAAEPPSAALGIGFCWSIVFGALAGALSAFFYNLFAPRG